jgi:hypothetical protein
MAGRRPREGEDNFHGVEAKSILARCGKRISFAPFYAENDHFNKTGSGKTQGKLKKKMCIYFAERAIA